MIRSIVLAAKNGDMAAAKMIIDRILPARKGRLVTFEMPKVKLASDVAAGMAAVVDQVATGQISPDEGATITGILDVRRKAIEATDLEARIAALEKEKEPR